MLAEGQVAHLAFNDDHDHPRVLPVTFALVSGRLFIAVDHKPKRVRPSELARLRYLRRRPRAALTVDRYDTHWRDLAWVQILARVEIVEAGSEPQAVKALCAKYPAYRERPPAGPLLKLEPTRALHWRSAGDRPDAG